MTQAPWLKPDGTYRCFFCETTRTSAGMQRDPDAWQQELRESHRILWSRPLPNGAVWSFKAKPKWYLKRIGPQGDEPTEWSVGSDNFATTHTNALPALAAAIPRYESGHLHDFCTIGGYIVFPNGRTQTRATKAPARKWTLNQAKGCERRISDRFDLTLEAIRLYFAGSVERKKNPIGDVLDAYGWFFDCFGQGVDGFNAYVDYFFLTPMVSGGCVKPLYGESLCWNAALPCGSNSHYQAYIEAQRHMVGERNELISKWWEQRVTP